MFLVIEVQPNKSSSQNGVFSGILTSIFSTGCELRRASKANFTSPTKAQFTSKERHSDHKVIFNRSEVLQYLQNDYDGEKLTK